MALRKPIVMGADGLPCVARPGDSLDPASAPGLAYAATRQLRVTTTSLTPVTPGDQLARPTLFLTPFTGSQYASFDDGVTPTIRASGEVAHAVSVPTADRYYDWFSYHAAAGLPALVGTPTSSVVSGVGGTAAMPAGIAAGDRIAAFAVSGGTNMAGYATALSQPDSDGSGGGVTLYTRTATGTAADTFANNGAGGTFPVTVYALRNAVLEAVHSDASLSAPSQTSGGAGRLQLCAFCANGNPAPSTTLTPPGTLAASGQVGAASQTLNAGHRAVAAAGATGPQAATCSPVSNVAAVAVLYGPSTLSGLQLERSAPYTAAHARADAVARNPSGVWVKAADPTRVLLCRTWCPTTAAVEDSAAHPILRVANAVTRSDYAADALGAMAADARAYDRLSALSVAEAALPANATVVALGRSYSVPGGGTTTLPQATAANAGRWVSLRVPPAATAPQTVTAPASAVGGRAAGDFLMVRGEGVDLWSDGANWLVRGGVCRPLSAGVVLGAAQAVAADVYTRVALDAGTDDDTGLMLGAVANAIRVPRAGLYAVSYRCPATAPGGGDLAASVMVTAFVQVSQAAVGSPGPLAAAVRVPFGGGETLPMRLAAGDYLHLGVLVPGVAGRVSPGALGAALRACEVPPW